MAFRFGFSVFHFFSFQNHQLPTPAALGLPSPTAVPALWWLGSFKSLEVVSGVSLVRLSKHPRPALFTVSPGSSYSFNKAQAEREKEKKHTALVVVVAVGRIAQTRQGVEEDPKQPWQVYLTICFNYRYRDTRALMPKCHPCKGAN